MEINKSYYSRLSEYVIISSEWKDRWARLISALLSPLAIAIAAVVMAAYGINDESAPNLDSNIYSIIHPTTNTIYYVFG